jgi:hypothetical protein
MNFPFLSKLGFDYLFLRSQLRAKWRSTITKMITTRISQGQQAKPNFYTFVTEKLDSSSEQLQNSGLFSEFLFSCPPVRGCPFDFRHCANFLTEYQMNLGGDTVSTAMTALFFYLSRYCQCYKILREEINTTFTASHRIRGGKQLSSCRYL